MTQEELAGAQVDLSPRLESDLEKMFLLAREGLPLDAINAFHQHHQVVNQFTVGQIVLSEPVVNAVRKELRRLFPELRVETGDLGDLLVNGVLKREVVDGEKVVEAKARMKKAEQKLARTVKKASTAPEPA